MSKVTKEQAAKWQEITVKCYAEQCKWFLNGRVFVVFVFLFFVY